MLTLTNKPIVSSERKKTPPNPHDGLHMFNGHCSCKCAKCWYEWKTLKYGTNETITVGICICDECPCPSDGRKYLSPFYGLTSKAMA